MNDIALFQALSLEARRRWLGDRSKPVWQHLSDVLRECGLRLVVSP